MLLNEIFDFLSERVKSTAAGDEGFKELMTNLPKLLNSWYKHNGKSMAFYEYKNNRNRLDDKDHTQASIDVISIKMQRWIDEILTIVANRYVGQRDLGGNLGKRDAYVTFDDLNAGKIGTTNGAYYMNYHAIKIDLKYIKPFAEAVYRKLEQVFYDCDYEFVDQVFDPEDSDFTDYVRNICEIFTHELAHAQQGEKVPHGVNDYNSYVIKDKKKFHAAIDKAAGRWDDEAYLASPQEAEAFAQQFVYNQLKWINDYEPEDQLQTIDDIIKYLGDEVKYSRYKGMTGDRPGVQKGKNRFLKKIYQELDGRRDEVKKQIEARKNRPEIPDDADYVE